MTTDSHLAKARSAVVDRCTEALDKLAHFFVGEPDDRVRARLELTRDNLERELSPTLGSEGAAAFALACVTAVMDRKHQLEAGSQLGVA